MRDLFRHLRIHTPATPDEGVDWAYLGEVVAFPPPGIRSLPSDPCDEPDATAPSIKHYWGKHRDVP